MMIAHTPAGLVAAVKSVVKRQVRRAEWRETPPLRQSAIGTPATEWRMKPLKRQADRFTFTSSDLHRPGALKKSGCQVSSVRSAMTKRVMLASVDSTNCLS